MFTGIIEAIGEVVSSEKIGGDLRLQLRAKNFDWASVKLGDSVATNGVCLTVVALPGDGFVADVSRETLTNATLEALRPGDRVNLERAMAASSRFDGHIVSGHVDGVARLQRRWQDARSLRLRFEVPAGLARYIARKGSICIDGVSLTVNTVEGNCFELNIVPHTAAETIIEGYREGCVVNIEVDVIARYLERLLESRAENPDASAIDRGFLAEHGFLKGRG